MESNVSVMLFLLASTFVIVSCTPAESKYDETALRSKYREFLVSFNKNLNRVDNVSRIAKFAQSLDFIDNHNEDSSLSREYSLALSQFADWLPSEIELHFKPLQTSYNKRSTIQSRLSTSEAVTLNWASLENPLGYPVVPPVQNQQNCGGCWAFAAAESVSACVNIDQELSPDSGSQVNLSIQQLLDCDDNSVNDGCNGGNPEAAYPYIVSNGLTSVENYPFIESAGQCLESYPAVAGITGYELLPQSEDAILAAIQTGPVAIGICANDQEFMYYSSGVLRFAACCTEINHAVVIVGYGVDSTTGLPYWLVQNSWGTGWGQNGFIQIYRNTDGGPGPGQCGLAVEASYPTGGFLTPGGNIPILYRIISLWNTIVEYLQQNFYYLVYSVAFVFISSFVLLYIVGCICDECNNNDTEMYSRIQDDGHCVVLYDLCGDEIYYDETDGYFSPYQYQRASAPVTTSDVLLQPMVAR